MAGPDSGIDERDADAGARERGVAPDAGPHLIGAHRLVRHRHERPHFDVAREVVDFGAERFDLRRIGLHHHALGQPLDDAHAKARGNRVEVARRVVQEHVDRAGRLGLDVLAEAFGQPARLAPHRTGGEDEGENGEGKRPKNGHEFP